MFYGILILPTWYSIITHIPTNYMIFPSIENMPIYCSIYIDMGIFYLYWYEWLIYCSHICPLSIYRDMIFPWKKYPYRYPVNHSSGEAENMHRERWPFGGFDLSYLRWAVKGQHRCSEARNSVDVHAINIYIYIYIYICTHIDTYT